MKLEDFQFEMWFKIPDTLDKEHRVRIAYALHQSYLDARDEIVDILKDAGYDPHWIDQSEPLESVIAENN